MTDKDSGLLQYIFHSHHAQVERSSDLVALACHATLIERGLKLASTSMVLTEDWSASDPIHLTYKKGDDPLFTLTVTQTPPNVLVTLSQGEKCFNTSLFAGDFVAATSADLKSSDFQRAFPNLSGLLQRLGKDVFDPLLEPPAPSTSSSSADRSTPQSQSPPGQRKPAAAIRPMNPNFPVPVGGPPGFDYGRSDLDPFGPMRPEWEPGIGIRPPGGMLMDPRFNGPRDPYGGLGIPRPPPGARFDPFMPPGLGGRANPRNPDPDFARGPDFDDMFM